MGRCRSLSVPPTDGGRHLDEVARGLVTHGGHRLEVLAGVGEHRLGVVQRLGRRRHVLTGDHGAPVVADVGERVDEAGAGRRILLGARPLLALVVVPHEHAGAVVAQVAVLAVDEHVAGGVAAGEHVAVRHQRDGLHDDRARQLGDLGGRSTSQPFFSSTSRARSLGKRMPTVSRTSSVASWMRSSSPALRTSQRSRGAIGLIREVIAATSQGSDDKGQGGSAVGGRSRCCSERARPRKRRDLKAAGAVDGADADAGCVGHGPESITALARDKPSRRGRRSGLAA